MKTGYTVYISCCMYLNSCVVLQNPVMDDLFETVASVIKQEVSDEIKQKLKGAYSVCLPYVFCCPFLLLYFFLLLLRIQCTDFSATWHWHKYLSGEWALFKGLL